MKILLVTGNYLPGKNGGIENYTHWLARILLRHGLKAEVAATDLATEDAYEYEGVKVHSLKNSFNRFEVLLQKENFDICHFQEYSEYGGIEIPWFKIAREYCKRVYFTFHLPYLTCYKLDFRYKGIEDCNTFSDEMRCTECVIAEKIYFKEHRSNLLLNFAEGLMGITGLEKKFKRQIVEKHHKLNQLMEICDHLFVYADWFKKILEENGYDQPSIKKIPYKSKTEIATAGLRQNTIKNRILFVGRIQHQKGLHLLSKAMSLITTPGIQLDVFGNIVDRHYYELCLRYFKFHYKGTRTHAQLLEKLHEYDFLIMPSVFTEMYSMMIKDSFYEKLPVIASTAKGNRDAVQEGVNGFLFEYGDAASLARTIDKAYRLKNENWQPIFTYPKDSQKDIQEIISYYS